jgi:tripartite-type tricarboxylate transporter receptor subunit TctC
VFSVASAARSPIYPEAATLREQGLSNVIASGWYGFMAPAATPGAIVDRLQAEIIRVLADPEVKQKLLAQGLEARPGTAAEFGKFIDDAQMGRGDPRGWPQGRVGFSSRTGPRRSAIARPAGPETVRR